MRREALKDKFRTVFDRPWRPRAEYRGRFGNGEFEFDSRGAVLRVQDTTKRQARAQDNLSQKIV